MALLDTAQRNKLPDSAFALPGRKYPLVDENHARNALARVSEYGTPAEQAAVRRKVAAKYPGIQEQKPKAEKRKQIKGI